MLTLDQLQALRSPLDPLSPTMAVSAATSLEIQTLTNIRLSDEERISQVISDENAARAITALHKDGIVCLSNAVDPVHIQVLHEKLEAEVPALRKMSNTYWNNNSADGSPTGNMAQGPPLDPKLMFSDVWANGPALAVISTVLGPNPRVNFVGGNTLLGDMKTVRQNVHPDLTFNHGTIPFAYCANVFLSDTNTENGSTELWLGSHQNCSYADQQPKVQKPGEPASKFGIKDSLLEERRRFAPPIQAEIPKGSVVVRDMRLWHAGVPSRSPKPRIMLAFVHTAWWYKCPTKVLLPESAKSLVDEWAERKNSVVYHANFIPEGIQYPPFTPNFDTENTAFRELLPKLLKDG